MFDPWENTITLPNAGTKYNLWELVSAIDPNAPDRVVAWQVQVDVSAGAARVATGNAQLSWAAGVFGHWGTILFATQATGRQSFGLNRLALRSTYLVSDTNNVQLGVVLVQA